MAISCLKDGKNGVFLSVFAVPRSSVTEIVDLREDRCKIKVKAPPVDGEANEVLLGYLAKLFGLSKRQIRIVQGAKGKKKTFFFDGITFTTAEKILLNMLNDAAAEKE